MGDNAFKIKNLMNLKPISADPSNPVEGDIQYSDGTHRAPGLWQYKATNGWVFVGASGGQKNYFNGLLSSDFTAYANTSAGNKPDDFGGSPSGNIAISDSSSTPLRGSTSILLAKSGGADEQGEGFYYEFTLDQTDIHSVMKFATQSFTDSNYADGDIRFYLVFSDDSFVADFKVVEFSATELLAGEYGQVSTYVQTHSSDTDVRFCIHVASTSTSNWNVKFDQEDWSFGPSVRNFGTPIIDWQTSTASLSWTTNTTHTVNESRVGKDLLLEGNITLAGAPDSATLVITLPYAMDTTIIDTNTDNSILGEFDYVDGGTRVTDAGKLRYTSSTTLTFTINDTDVTQASPITWANTDEINYRIRVPIAGWSSNTQMSDDADQRVIAARYDTDAGQSIDTGSFEIVNFDSKTYGFDTHNAVTTGAAWKFTAPVSGYYLVNSFIQYASVAWTAGQIGILHVYKNGSDNARLDLNEVEANGTYNITLDGSVVVEMDKGDYIDIRAYQNTGSGITLESDEEKNYVTVHKVQGPSTISSTETIAAAYDTDAGQSIDNDSFEIVNFDSTTFGYDTHGSVTTGASWKFTAPATGYYSVKVFLQFADSANWNAGESAVLDIYKNGTYTRRLAYNEIQANGTYIVGVGGGTELQLDKGDYIDARVYQNTGSALALSSAEEANHITIHRIGI